MKNVTVRILMLALALSLLLVVVAPTQALPAQQTNLLKNAGFELPYSNKGEADGWGRWHRQSSEDKLDECTNGYHVLPAWSPETVSSGLIHSGGASQHVGNQWRTWAGGVFQTVSNVTPGSTYRFTVYAYGRGSSDNYPAASETGLLMNVRVGIDPNGSSLWNDGDVFWSGTINPHDIWQPVSVEVTATGNQLTVFTAADWGVEGVNQCRKHLDVWFDTAELIEVGPPPTNTPAPLPTLPPATAVPPTATPIPATDTPDIPPTVTPVPPTEVPTQPPGGTICVNAFADDNGNGARDENEGYMGNVTFTIANGSQVVSQAVSTGTDAPFCVEGLAAGSYQIAQNVPGRLEMTTAGNATIQVEVGRTVGIEFGSRLRDESTEVANAEVPVPAEPTAEPTTAPPPEQAENGFDLAAISGLLVMVVAVILLGALIFLALRRNS